jgi:hypothetical protein
MTDAVSQNVKLDIDFLLPRSILDAANLNPACEDPVRAA